MSGGKSDTVGYGKPPQATRFQKGRSGNPNGRPKKQPAPPVRFGDGSVAKAIERGSLRTVPVTVGGKPVDMPVTEAMVHALQQQAIKGNRLSAKHLLKLAIEQEEKARHEAAESYDYWVGHKRREAAALIRAKQERRDYPRPYPHPDDIIVDADSRTYHIIGPFNPEDAVRFDGQDLRCEWLLGKSVELELRVGRPVDGVCHYALAAYLTHEMLPPSYGGGDSFNFTSRTMQWHSLSRRARARRLADLQYRTPRHRSMFRSGWKSARPSSRRMPACSTCSAAALNCSVRR